MGGLLVKKLKLKVRGIIRMDLIVAITALIFGCLFFIQCPKMQMAGVTSEYITKGSVFLLNNVQLLMLYACKVKNRVMGIIGRIFIEILEMSRVT